jgi:undecaprenyl-diphosphatase
MPDQTSTFWEISLLLLGEILISMILFSGAIAIIVFLARRPLRKYKPVDMGIFEKLNFLTSPFNNRVMLGITFLGKHQFLVPANLVLIFYFSLVSHQNWFSIRVTVIALSSLVLMFLLKYLFKRKRPLSPLLKAVKGLSFPSGHAIMAVTFYGLLIYILENTIDIPWIRTLVTCLLLLLILLIGFSRVYLRVHYASDVLAGFIVGILWLLISMSVLANLEVYAGN